MLTLTLLQDILKTLNKSPEIDANQSEKFMSALKAASGLEEFSREDLISKLDEIMITQSDEPTDKQNQEDYHNSLFAVNPIRTVSATPSSSPKPNPEPSTEVQ